MKPEPIKPGDVCVIIFGEAEYRQNVGAMLTAVEEQVHVCKCGCGRRKVGWVFKEASRPLAACVPLDPFGIFQRVMFVNDSWEYARLAGTGALGCYPAEHLMPIRNPDQGVEDEVEATPPGVKVPA